jgi:hypothetical protein
LGTTGNCACISPANPHLVGEKYYNQETAS